jgi:Protein of unknown function (DUF1254)
MGITVEEAQSIAQDAYIYFYPLVLLDISRKHFTNIEPDKMFARGPMNTFSHARTFPPATLRGAIHPNFDTLYSNGWLDLTKEPVVITVPDTHGRYYLLQLLDMWMDTFAGVGKRTTGTGPSNLLWSGLTGRARSPKVSSESMLRLRLYGLLDAPGPTALRITKPSAKRRTVTKSRCCRSGASRRRLSG